MLPDKNLKGNIERFSGFAGYYDKYRPEAPQMVVEILTGYLGRRPEMVVDLASGTGLSTFIWKDYAGRVIGVEPNGDMRGRASEKLAGTGNASNISFQEGYSNRMNMEAESVDIITCSQAFHWMEPESTLEEVSKVLKGGGVFAAYDCDWPPTVHWTLENEFIKLHGKADEISGRILKPEDRAFKRNKNEHLKNLKESKRFRFTREIVFHNLEKCDAERYAGLALSQGGVQAVIKSGVQEINPQIEKFTRTVEEYFGGRTIDIMFSYRMRLGIK